MLHLHTLALHVPIHDLRLNLEGGQILINFQARSAGACVVPRPKLEFGSGDAIEPSEAKPIKPGAPACARAKQ